MMTKATTLLGETRSEESESEESECEESENGERESEEEFEPHSQRDLVAQDVGIMHQVSYSSSVSTFGLNEIKDRNYMSVQQHIFISFSFQEKNNGCPPPPKCSMSFSLEIFHSPPKS